MRRSSVIAVPLVAVVLAVQLPAARITSQPDDPPRTARGWVAALRDRQDQVLRQAARNALGPDGPFPRSAAAALIDALNDPTEDICETLAEHGSAVVSRLVRILDQPDPSRCAGAARTLGLIRPRPLNAVPALIRATKDADEQVRAEAVGGLGEMRKAADAAVPAIVAALADDDEWVRCAAANALAKLVRRPGPAVAALAAALKDEAPYARRLAGLAIQRIGPAAAAAVPALAAAMKGDRTDPSRDAYAWALSGIGPAARDAVPQLADALADANEDVRRAAAFALGEIGPPAAPAVTPLRVLAKQGGGNDADSAIVALGKIGEAATAAVPALLDELARREHVLGRDLIARSLGRIGPNARAAVPVLTALARDVRADSPDREAAAWAVAQIDPAFAASEKIEFAHLNVRLGTVPVVPLRRRPPAEGQAARMRSLIAELAGIDLPDLGLSGTLTGHTFAPLPGLSEMNSGLIADHDLGTSTALRSLVEAGPAALPFLLDAVGDRTPTKLRVRRFPGSVMLVGGGLPAGNPFNRTETRAVALEPGGDDEDEDDDRGTYTVTVGDVCFVAIGQIVGRPYRAVEYIPTAIVGVNSPTACPHLQVQLRAAWAGGDPARVLLDSLLIDYATEGIFNGHSLDGWADGSDYQVAAAVRLLYYFPDETAPLIAARLKAMDVALVPLDGISLRDVRNRVRTTDFSRAVSWCPAPAIRDALADVAKRTDDPRITKAIAGKR